MSFVELPPGLMAGRYFLFTEVLAAHYHFLQPINVAVTSQPEIKRHNFQIPHLQTKIWLEQYFRSEARVQKKEKKGKKGGKKENKGATSDFCSVFFQSQEHICSITTSTVPLCVFIFCLLLPAFSAKSPLFYVHERGRCTATVS